MNELSRFGHRLEQSDPLEVLLVCGRQRGLDPASSRVVSKSIVERKEGDLGADTQEVDIPARLDPSHPWTKRVEHSVGRYVARFEDGLAALPFVGVLSHRHTGVGRKIASPHCTWPPGP